MPPQPHRDHRIGDDRHPRRRDQCLAAPAVQIQQYHNGPAHQQLPVANLTREHILFQLFHVEQQALESAENLKDHRKKLEQFEKTCDQLTNTMTEKRAEKAKLQKEVLRLDRQIRKTQQKFEDAVQLVIR